MVRITLSAEAAAQIRSAEGTVVFCDEQGNPVRSVALPDYPDHEPVLSEEEWQRRLAEPGGMTTPELVEHLKKLRP